MIMKSKNVNTKKTKTPKSKSPAYTRQNADLYKAFLKTKPKTNNRTKITLVGTKVGRRTSAKLNDKQSQYLFKRLASKQWKYDKKTNTFKVVGRSPFNKKTILKHQAKINQVAQRFQQLLSDKLQDISGLENINDYQVDVLANIYNSGIDIEVFKSNYPDAFERIFNESDEL